MIEELLTDSTLTSFSDDSRSRWRFDFAPYIWLPSVEGTAGVGRISTSVNWSTGDWLEVMHEELDLAALGRLEIRGERVGFFVDASYLSFKLEGEVLRRDVHVEITQLLAEVGASYRIGQWHLGDDEAIPVSLELLGGARIVSAKADVFMQRRGSAETSKEWIDPIVGGRVGLQATEKLAFTVRGDIGGFGVGSDLSWSLTAGLRWDFARHGTLGVGYRILDIDYHDGTGSDSFVYDLQMSGPMLGLIFTF